MRNKVYKSHGVSEEDRVNFSRGTPPRFAQLVARLHCLKKEERERESLSKKNAKGLRESGQVC